MTELLKSGRSGLIIVRGCHLSFRECIICTDSAIKKYFIGFKKSVQNCSRFQLFEQSTNKSIFCTSVSLLLCKMILQFSGLSE